MLQDAALSLPIDAVVRPALHGRHLLLPSLVEYEPRGQSMHACDRGLLVNWPAGHIMHSVEPGLKLNEPAGQSTQVMTESAALRVE